MKKNKISKLQHQRLDEIASFIKNWRLNEGLSQFQFSLLAKIHVNSVANIERKKSVNFSTICACVDAMEGMTLAELFIDME